MSGPAVNASYFDEIPDWPDFAITNDKISGRVPVTKIPDWRVFSSILEQDFFNRKGNQLIYRGQRRYDWPLSPSLGRLDERNIVTKEIAEAQLALFRRAVRGRLDDRSLVDEAEEYELWAVGQHYGLMTPLLDWSYSPYVALFFAFEREDRALEEPNPYRAIYVLNKTYVEGDDRCPEVNVLEPRKDDYGRLVNQAGLFTHSAYGETLEISLINSLEEEVLGDIQEGSEASALSRYICKIYIANVQRIECLRRLRLMNVHHASLFPDLIGASEYCNALAAEDAAARRSAFGPAPEAADVVSAEAQTVIESLPLPERDSAAAAILRALASPSASREVESPRLGLISNELATEIAKHQYVDWQKRDSVQAAMRTSARTVLRKLGYPAAAREEAIDAIFTELNKRG